MNIEKPQKSFRPIIVPLITVINISVFVLWLSTGQAESSFMTEHFLTSWTALSQGRYWTLLTSVFSHNMLLHLFLNMFVLQSFGIFLEKVLGSSSFLKFYIIAGVFSSFCHCVVSLLIMNAPDLAALGASGAIAGLILVFSLIFPRAKILILGILPMPALIGAILFIGLDVWGLVEQAKGSGLPIGHGAHLGGAVAGIVYFLFFIRPRLQRAEELTYL